MVPTTNLNEHGQIFLFSALIIGILLLSWGLLFLNIGYTQIHKNEEDIFFVHENIKEETIQVVEISLAQYCQILNDGNNVDGHEILVRNLDNWITYAINYCLDKGYNLSIFYDKISMIIGCKWERDLGISRAKVSFNLIIESNSIKICDNFDAHIQVKLEVIPDQNLRVHFYKSYNNEKWFPIVSGRVVGDNGEYFTANGDGSYVLISSSDLERIEAMDIQGQNICVNVLVG